MASSRGSDQRVDPDTPSAFAKTPSVPPVTMHKLHADFKADPCKQKVDLSVGEFRLEDSTPWVLPVVADVERKLAFDSTIVKSALPATGNPDFCRLASELILGASHPALLENRCLTVQAISGTGAIRLGADYLRNHYAMFENTPVYLSDPTWSNHVGIFRAAGFSNIKTYRYWDEDTKAIDFPGLMDDLQRAPLGSIVVFQASGHNPTGIDLELRQWKTLARVMIDSQILPFFHLTGQGLASGDLDVDVTAIKIFTNHGYEMLIASSYSQNFSLYTDRVGALTCISKRADHIPSVKSQLSRLIRTSYVSPPSRGALIIATILSSRELKQEWLEQVEFMADHLRKCRIHLKEALERAGVTGKWDHLTRQIGMYSYTCLTATQCEWLRGSRSIYLPNSGRINVSGVNPENVEYLAACFREACGAHQKA